MVTNSLAEKIRQGNVRALAQGISIIENCTSEAVVLMKEIFCHTGNAKVIGITGSPGAGKSSLVDKLALLYRKTGEKVGILAIDPSSPFSGGAILGDRIRMQSLATDPGIFIRSMATRGNLGGLARATSDAVLLLDAAGYQKIIIETVGVGQDEVEIVKTANVTLVVLVPGMGDDVQSIKAGIMEIGDIFVINKADRDGVERIHKEIESLLSLTERFDGWNPPIIRTIATATNNLDGLAEAIASYLVFLQDKRNTTKDRNIYLAQQKLLALLTEKLVFHVRHKIINEEEWTNWAMQISNRKMDPYSIVEQILNRLAPTSTNRNIS